MKRRNNCTVLFKSSTTTLALAGAILLAISATAVAQQATTPGTGTTATANPVPQWIWGPDVAAGKVPLKPCYFRKSFTIGRPENAQLTITADDQYEVYVNGKKVGTGIGWNKTHQYDITGMLKNGKNLIAVKATNIRTGHAGLAASLIVQQEGNTTRVINTDTSWRTNSSPLALWQYAPYRDDLWAQAQSFGFKGQTSPWSKAKKATIAKTNTVRVDRFKVPEGFEVQRVLGGDQTGSLLAITFDEFGRLLASQENGPLVAISDADHDGHLEKVTVVCDEVKNCRGIESLNGDIYVTAEGPEGSGLYVLKYDPKTKKMKVGSCLVHFSGEMHEYGPHGITFGPDGMFYVSVGSFSRPKDDCAETGPYGYTYEGDLVRPRMEDPGEHGVGIRAPGGFILRVSPDGKKKEVFAAGLRNSRDLTFTENGDLFVHDTAMHWDEGAPWYRPTRLSHVIPGAEFGWRSGWAKWPEYYVDSLPASIDTGPGASTGIVQYSHIKFPKKYRGAIFVADWTNGKIKSLRLQEDGATWTGSAETFVEGDPLNASDMTVGPDGALYFSTGGRKTPGGIYRVVWTGKSYDLDKYLGKGMTAAIRYPQLGSAWSRQSLALLRTKLGDSWDTSLPKIVATPQNPDSYRLRALDLMSLFGPEPTPELLLTLSEDQSDAVRGKAVDLMSTSTSDRFDGRLVAMLEDDNPMVRRRACEALARKGAQVPTDKLVTMLGSSDRFEAWAARRALEKAPLELWKEKILQTDNQREFIQGAVALLGTNASKENAQAVIARARHFMNGYVSDSDFIDMLRILQIALIRGEIKPEDAVELRQSLALEFPANHHQINRELARLLTYLKERKVGNRYVAYLEDTETPDIEKMHLALHMATTPELWTNTQKIAVFKTLDKLAAAKGGASLDGYLTHATTALVNTLDEEGCRQVLVHGDRMPGAALGVLRILDNRQDPQILAYLRSLDRRVSRQNTQTARLFGTGVIGALAESGDEQSMAYLREIFNNQPERRPMAAIGLAQSPDGPNWEYLVKSLPIVEGESAIFVLQGLLQSDKKPESPEPFRQVILQGTRLGKNGGSFATTLLEKWTDARPATQDDTPEEAIEKWQQWFAQTYPDHPTATLPEEGTNEKWSAEALLSFLEKTPSRPGAVKSGSQVFQKVGCTKCHECNGVGNASGPNLTNLANRLNRKEAVESMLYPSHVINGEYPTRRFILKSGRVTEGLAQPADDNKISLLTSEGRTVTIRPEQIGDISSSKESIMPRGLLDNLTPDEIANLFTYLTYKPIRVTTIPKESPQ